jgi:outer membrane lipoprotein SlyB
MKLKLFFISTLISTSFFLASCGRDLSSDVYTSDSTLSLTLEGKILSVRPITIKDNDKAEFGAGALGGGAIGAASGATVGSGSGQVAAAVGGAVAGAVIGAVAENQLGQSQGYEYIIKVDNSKLKDTYYEGSGAMRSAISSATTNGLVTIVQGADVVLQKGDPVYVIFSDKRSRVVKAE